MKILLAFLVLLAPLSLYAQDDTEKELSHHAVGLSASMLSGPGISYQYIFNADHRAKLTAFGFYEKNESGYSDLTMIFGGEYQYTAVQTRSTRFYILLGASYWKEKNTYSSTSYPDYTPYSSINQYTTLTAGGGIGIEVAIERHFLISIDGLLHYRNYEREYSQNLQYSTGSPSEYFGPGIGFSVHYRF